MHVDYFLGEYMIIGYLDPWDYYLSPKNISKLFILPKP